MLKRILHYIRVALRGLGRLSMRGLGFLFGRRGQPALPYEDAVEAEVEELKEELASEAQAPSLAAQTLGEKVHRYVSGDRQARDAYDMNQLPEHVGITLLTLPESARILLAKAGPEKCGRWALGERTGLVGVPLCRQESLAARARRKLGGRPAFVPAGEAPSEEHGLAFA